MTPRWPRFCCAITSFTVVFLLVSSSARPDEDFSPKSAITALADPEKRSDAAHYLINNWRRTLGPLIDELNSYAGTNEPPDSEKVSAVLLPISDVIRTIVYNEEDSIDAFRRLNNDKTIKVLARLARGADRALRINSTYILANVIDNRYICIVFQNLRDAKLDPNGAANLSQIATSVASYAYKETVEDGQKTISMIRDRFSGSSEASRFIDVLQNRLSSSRNVESHIPNSYYCKNYDYSSPL